MTDKQKIEIGRKYGMLTVIAKYRDRSRKYGRTLYSCLCDCGNTCVRTGQQLLKTKNPNCGCKSWNEFLPEIPEWTKNMVGKRYGQLVVLEALPSLPESKESLPRVLYQCDCGNKFIAVANRVKSGNTKTCGHNRDYLLAKGRKAVQDKCIDGTNLTSLSDKRKLNKNSTTGHRGVSLDQNTGKYRAYINFKRKQYQLGEYKNIEDAIQARKKAEKRIYGEFIEQYNKKE